MVGTVSFHSREGLCVCHPKRGKGTWGVSLTNKPYWKSVWHRTGPFLLLYLVPWAFLILELHYLFLSWFVDYNSLEVTKLLADVWTGQPESVYLQSGADMGMKLLSKPSVLTREISSHKIHVMNECQEWGVEGRTPDAWDAACSCLLVARNRNGCFQSPFLRSRSKWKLPF